MPVYASQNSPETNQGFLHYLLLLKCPLMEKSLSKVIVHFLGRTYANQNWLQKTRYAYGKTMWN